MQFNSLEELYQRIKPALQAKLSEINRLGYTYIKIEDIWNYLKEVKWIKSTGLDLYQMVNDVLETDVIVIDSYLKDKLNRGNRRKYFDV